MGYTFVCDGCATQYDHSPPFMGEFRETFLKTADTALVDRFQPGQTVTLCRLCSEDLFL